MNKEEVKMNGNDWLATYVKDFIKIKNFKKKYKNVANFEAL